MRGHLIVDLPLLAAAGALFPLTGGWSFLGAAGLSAAIHSWAVVDPRASLYHRVHWRLPPIGGGLALTFDDGPDPEVTPAVLDLLAEAGMTATFFVIGEHATAHPDIVRRAAAAGHALGVHSQHHYRTFPLLGPAKIRAELATCAATIGDITGEAPRLFRPPMGLTTPLTAWGQRGSGLVTVTWSVGSRDTRLGDPDRIAARVRRGLGPGAIVLLHDGSEPLHPRSRSVTVPALRLILADLQRAGLGSRSLTVVDGRPALAAADAG